MSWSQRMPAPVPPLRCRQIGESDIAAVAALLARGFHNRDRQFWLRAFAQLRVASRRRGCRNMVTSWKAAACRSGRFSLSARWCARRAQPARSFPAATCRAGTSNPSFRAYAPLLVSQALRHKHVTYLNVSPAPHTRPIIEAQGFSRYCDGVFVAVPMLNGLYGGGVGLQRGGAVALTHAGLIPSNRMLVQHAALGCISLWCTHAQSAYPFVFRTRLVKSPYPRAVDLSAATLPISSALPVRSVASSRCAGRPPRHR